MIASATATPAILAAERRRRNPWTKWWRRQSPEEIWGCWRRFRRFRKRIRMSTKRRRKSNGLYGIRMTTRQGRKGRARAAPRATARQEGEEKAAKTRRCFRVLPRSSGPSGAPRIGWAVLASFWRLPENQEHSKKYETFVESSKTMTFYFHCFFFKKTEQESSSLKTKVFRNVKVHRSQNKTLFLVTSFKISSL